MESGDKAKNEFSQRLRKWRSQMATEDGVLFSQELAAEHLQVNLNSYRKWEQGSVLPRAEIAMDLDAKMREMGI